MAKFKEIKEIKIPSDIVEVVENRIRILIASCIHSSDANTLIMNIARNCYMQGVIDGEQLNKKRKESDE